jgi:hypothetical protein
MSTPAERRAEMVREILARIAARQAEARMEQQGETAGQVVYVLENRTAGRVYISQPRPADPEAGQ